MDLLINYGISSSSLTPILYSFLKFFAIPANSGQIRLKINSDATNIKIYQKTSSFTSTPTDGTLIGDFMNYSSYSGDNQWLTVSGLSNGTLYYFRAIPNDDLSIAEVTQAKAGGLYLEYTMDSISGSQILDTSGNSRHTTFFNNPTFQEGVIGNAVFGNGTNTYISRAGNFGLTSGRTIVGWINTGTINGTYLDYYGSDQYTVWGRNGSNFAVFGNLASKSIPITDNEWLFVCARNTGTSFKVNFNNGATQTFTASSFPHASYFVMLSNYVNDAAFTNGAIDNFRVYGRELEDYEITNLYFESPLISEVTPIVNELTIYNSGNEFSSVTGGWTSMLYNPTRGSAAFTKNSTNLQIVTTSNTANSYVWGLYQTNTPIDFTNYATMHIDFSATGSAFTIGTSKWTSSASGANLFYVDALTTNFPRAVRTYDITNANGLGYVAIAAPAISGQTRQLNVYKIWFT